MAAQERPDPSCQERTAWQLFAFFARLGATAFGGPAVLARMREVTVVPRGWLASETFDEGFVLSQTVPGATAMQCAAYIGLRSCGLRGAAAATVGFCLPAFVLMLVASVLYGRVAGWDAGEAVLQGLRAVVIAIVASSALDLGRRQLGQRRELAIAAMAAALMLAKCSPILVIAIAAMAGVALLRGSGQGANTSRQGSLQAGHIAKHVGLVLVCAAALLAALFASAPMLGRLAVVMMKVSVFAFGGGYAALPLMLHACVTGHGWLSAGQFMDGVALAQVSPGPLSIVAAFVGYKVGSLFGAMVATISVFFPCWVITIAVAPWFERLQRFHLFRAATRGAAVSLAGLLLAVAFQFGQTVSWSVLHALLAAAALIALQLRVTILWIVLAAGIAAGVLG
jgi:chromate transporter